MRPGPPAWARAACARRSSRPRWRRPAACVRDRHGGARPGVLDAAVAGEPWGTRFHADARAASFKLWLRYGRPSGPPDVDDGARRAWRTGASCSRSACGVEGRFRAGDAGHRSAAPTARRSRRAWRRRRRRAAPCRRQAVVGGRAGRGRASRLSWVHGDRRPDVSLRARAAARSSRSRVADEKDAALEAIALRIERSATRSPSERGGRRRCPRGRHERRADRPAGARRARVAALARRVRSVALLADPVGEIVSRLAPAERARRAEGAHPSRRPARRLRGASERRPRRRRARDQERQRVHPACAARARAGRTPS